jgi:hypothetical protein
VAQPSSDHQILTVLLGAIAASIMEAGPACSLPLVEQRIHRMTDSAVRTAAAELLVDWAGHIEYVLTRAGRLAAETQLLDERAAPERRAHYWRELDKLSTLYEALKQMVIAAHCISPGCCVVVASVSLDALRDIEIVLCASRLRVRSSLRRRALCRCSSRALARVRSSDGLSAWVRRLNQW